MDRLLHEKMHANVWFNDGTNTQIQYHAGFALKEQLEKEGYKLFPVSGLYWQDCWIVINSGSTINMITFWTEEQVDLLKEQNELQKNEEKKDIF